MEGSAGLEPEILNTLGTFMKEKRPQLVLTLCQLNEYPTQETLHIRDLISPTAEFNLLLFPLAYEGNIAQKCN